MKAISNIRISPNTIGLTVLLLVCIFAIMPNAYAATGKVVSDSNARTYQEAAPFTISEGVTIVGKAKGHFPGFRMVYEPDWYKFKVKKGCRVKMDVSGSYEYSGIDCAVYHGGYVKNEDTTYYSLTNISAQNSRYNSPDPLYLEKGVYYIKVYTRNCLAPEEKYTVKFTNYKPWEDVSEPNDTKSKAVPLKIGRTYHGMIRNTLSRSTHSNAESDVDYYKLKCRKGTYSVTVNYKKANKNYSSIYVNKNQVNVGKKISMTIKVSKTSTKYIKISNCVSSPGLYMIKVKKIK